MSRSRLVARNLAVTMATQIISWGLTFIVLIYLPRYAGAVGLGKLTLGFSFGVIFALFIELGMNTVLIRDIARDREKTGPYLLTTLGIRLTTGILTIGLATLTAKFLGYSKEMQLIVGVSMGATVVSQLNDAIASALRGLENFPRVSAAALVEKVTYASAMIWLIVHHKPIWTLAGVVALSMTVSICISLPAVLPYFRTMQMPKLPALRELLINGRPFWTVAIFSALYTQIDPILLSKMSSYSAVGWYGLAKRFASPTFFIPIALCATMLPTLSRVYHEDLPAFAGAVRRLINLSMICAVPFAAVLIMAPRQLIRLLKYPASFDPAIPVLMIFGCAVIIWYLTQILGTTLVACNRQVALSKAMAYSALLSVPTCALCIFLAQRFLHNGAIGAISSDVIVESFMLTMYIRAMPPNLLTGSFVHVLIRAVIAILPFIGIFYFVPSKNIYLILIGIALYGPLCWFMKCLHPQDMQMLRQMLRKKANA